MGTVLGAPASVLVGRVSCWAELQEPSPARKLLGALLLLQTCRPASLYDCQQNLFSRHSRAVLVARRFRDWQRRQEDQAPTLQAASPPGRVLWLARLPGSAAAAAGASDGGASASRGSCSSGLGVGEPGWGALWVSWQDVAAWGLRPSRHALADHHASRLLGVLGELAGLAAANGAEAA